MVELIILIEPTASWVAVCMPAIWTPISSVALAVCPASALTSWATTLKPRPASPARAASMVALSANRLVCSATEVISLITSPIRLAACDSALIRESVSSAWVTALAAMRFGFLDLHRDLAHRTGELLGRRGHRLHFAGSLRRGIGDHAGKPRGVAGIVAQRARGAFQFVRCRRQRGDEGAEAVARLRDGVFPDLAVGAEIDRDDVFGIQHHGLGNGVAHRALAVARGLRGASEAGHLDFALDRLHQLVGEEHQPAADIPLRGHAGAPVEFA